MKHIHLYCLTLYCLLVCACTRQPVILDPAETDGAWQRYLDANVHTQPAAARYQMSLRFGTEGDSRRVTALMWGNADGPLRLDIMAGVGVCVAKIAETENSFLLYAPHEKKAYTHKGPQKPLFKTGMPIPLNLAYIYSLLEGDYMALFGQRHHGAMLDAQGQVFFTLQDGPLTGMLTLTEQGLPALWKQEGKGWEMRISYSEGNPPLPRRLDLTHMDGHHVILLIKNREMLNNAFSSAQLRLTLSEKIPLVPLADYKGERK